MSGEFIFADTNLFLRYLTNDVAEQAEAFERMLHRAARGEISLITNNLVLAEIIWTLESYYQLSKEMIQENVLAILNTPGLEVDEGQLVLKAILWYVEKNVDFIDAYNAAWADSRGIETICTFDRKHFSRVEGLIAIAPGE